MNNTQIRSFKELIAEKQRLKNVYYEQKLVLKNDLISLKDDLNPVKQILNKLSLFTSPDKSLGLLNVGLSFGLDFILKKLLFKKAGWIIKLVAPFFIKNALLNLAAKKIREDIPELKSFLEKTRKKV